MSKISELFKQGNYDELWQRCCGFIDLSLDDFMKIQRRLLLEQMELLRGCELGRQIFRGASPRSLEEFREMVPLTSYDDYAPFLLKRRMDVLPRKPILWQYTSGKSGEYSFRWAPVTARQLDELEPLVIALALLSSCNGRGDTAFRKGDKVFYGMAPPPYATGTMARVFPPGIFRFLPPPEQAEMMSFEDRIRNGFDMALSEGLDICFAMSSLTVAIGQRLGQKNGRRSLKKLLANPKTLLRLAKGKLKARMAGRSILPRDIWPLKGLITFGIDGSVYREKIKQMWGRYPLDFHGCTEAPLIATQTWDYEGMTFFPHLNFFEFISEDEAAKSRQNPSYQPATQLMDEIKPGKYELVITSFQGGPFVRYRLGHLVEITALRNDKLNIDIPQMVFLSRVDDQIDIAGFTRLSEKVIWQAIENSGLAYEDWIAHKETSQDCPRLRLCIEPRQDNNSSAEEIAAAIHEELKKLDAPYAELESFTGLRPLAVSLLPQGAFKLYKMKQQAAGAELAHFKPPHINPSPAIIDYLVSATAGVTVREEHRVEA
jgi:hypothetical protein